MADLTPESLLIFTALWGVLDNDQVVRSTLEQALDVTGSDLAVLRVRMGAVVLYVGLDSAFLDEPLMRQTTRSGLATAITEVEVHTEVASVECVGDCDFARSWGGRAYVAAPVEVSAGFEGALICVSSTPRAYSDEQVQGLPRLSFSLAGRFDSPPPARQLASPTQLARRVRALSAGLSHLQELLEGHPDLLDTWLEFAKAVEQMANTLERSRTKVGVSAA